MASPLAPTTRSTQPIAGQKPGTSGLRKKTKTFMQVLSSPGWGALIRSMKGVLCGLLAMQWRGGSSCACVNLESSEEKAWAARLEPLMYLKGLGLYLRNLRRRRSLSGWKGGRDVPLSFEAIVVPDGLRKQREVAALR